MPPKKAAPPTPTDEEVRAHAMCLSALSHPFDMSVRVAPFKPQRCRHATL